MKNIILLTIISIALTGCSTMPKQTQVMPGMNHEAVKLAWGNPQKIQNHKNSCCKPLDEESWYYFNPTIRKTAQPKYVLFKNDVVENVYVWKK